MQLKIQKNYRWWVLLPTTVVSIFLLLTLLTGCREEKQGPMVGTTIQSLRIITAEGITKNLQFPLDQPVFIEFWASWCPNCVANIPKVNEIYTLYKDQLIFFGLSLDRSTKTIDKAIQQHHILYPCTRASSKHINTFGVTGIPVTFLIDRQGTIIYHHAGKVSTDILQKKIDALLP